MDTKCNRDVILNISLLKFDWKRVGNRLLDDQDVIDIDREEHEEQNKREKMLLKWLQQKGGRATYRRLVEVLEVLKCKETAEAVTRLVMDDGKNCQPHKIALEESNVIIFKIIVNVSIVM